MKATKEKGSKKNENIQSSKGVFGVCVYYINNQVLKGEVEDLGEAEKGTLDRKTT
jgi:hypothetical protein